MADSIPNPVTVGRSRSARARPLALIAGPCVMEPGDMTMRIARRLVEICDVAGRPLDLQGLVRQGQPDVGRAIAGRDCDEGMKVFARIKAETGLPVTTDVHETHQAAPIAEVVDLLQVPAFLARQTDLLEAAARTGRPVNVKKGQFMAPWDMGNVVAKLIAFGASGAILTERGTTFGYGRLVNDFRAIPQMQATGRPVVFDATHSVQLPGGGAGGTTTSGQREMIPTLARAAVAAGCDALFLEVHPDPDQALSDGPNSLRLDDLEPLLSGLPADPRGDHRRLGGLTGRQSLEPSSTVPGRSVSMPRPNPSLRQSRTSKSAARRPRRGLDARRARSQNRVFALDVRRFGSPLTPRYRIAAIGSQECFTL